MLLGRFSTAWRSGKFELIDSQITIDEMTLFAMTQIIACVQPPLPSNKIPDFWAEGAGVTRLPKNEKEKKKKRKIHFIENVILAGLTTDLGFFPFLDNLAVQLLQLVPRTPGVSQTSWYQREV